MPHRHRPARGFTLIELLVVIGVIALLIGILFPIVGKAREQARLTVCMANVRSLSQACNTYATQNGGQFPGLEMLGTGANLWDVPKSFYDALRKEGLKHEAFFCPATDNLEGALQGFTAYPTFYIIGYNFWIPRKNGSNIIPPPITGTTTLTFPTPKPTKPIAGPADMGDLQGIINPIVTDHVGTGGTPPADADVSVAGNGFGLAGNSNHRVGDRLTSINAGYADGHVELIPGKAVRPRYKGNWWNWR